MLKFRDRSQPLIKSKQHEFVMPVSETNNCYFHPTAKAEWMPSGIRIGANMSPAKNFDDEASSPLKVHQPKRNEERFLRQKKASKPVVSTDNYVLTALETEGLQGA